MPEETPGTALVKRVTELAAKLPASPTELVERIRAIRQEAHVLSPATTAASIPPHIRINTVVEVIDTTFDRKTGRGNDVYFQASIHKSEKKGRGDDATFEPLEVSLNATAIKRLMGAVGVSVTASTEILTGEQNHWKWQSVGKIRDFDGSWRSLPPGTADVDLRDGSAQIGEWTREEWDKREKEAEAKAAKLSDRDKWKAKPRPINGWSGDRVMAARRFGLRLAEAKSLNALGRNVGLKQIYSLEELKKPFVIFRATFNPDMNDPEIKRMVHAAELGALDALYPNRGQAALPAAAPSGESAEGHVIDMHVEPETHEAETASKMPAGPAQPADAEPVLFDDEAVADEPPQEYHITGIFQFENKTKFYLTTAETKDLHIRIEAALVRPANAAFVAKTTVFLELERRDGETWAVELKEVGKKAL